MKNLLYLVILVALFSCEGEPLIKEPNLEFGEPYPSANGGNNVWLRPYIGFSDYIMRNDENSFFTYYCDTSPEPTTIVRYDKSNFPWVITSDPLKPKTKYYWYCMASVDAKYTKGSCLSEIYSFQTIDTSLMFNRRWGIYYYVNYDEYKSNTYQYYWGLEYQVWDDNEELFAEIGSFEITKDSVYNINYLGIFNDEDFPQRGLFKFSYDSIQILDKTFEFVNFGKPDNETLELVMKKTDVDYILIYRSIL